MAANELWSDKELSTLRRRYKRKMNSYYSKESFSGPWTQKWVRDIENMLRNVPKLSLSKVGLYHKFVKDKFYLGGIDEGGHLIRVLKTSEEEMHLPAVPWEDAFDPIWQAHIACGHGNVTEVMKVLKKSYFIDVACVREVVNICTVCSKSNAPSDSLKTIFNERAQIIFLDMTSTPDGLYNYILIYIDEATGLTQLRAVFDLSSLEIALKLLNIFTDIGPPKTLKISDSVVDYVKVMDTINIIFQPSDITLEASVHHNQRADEIKKLVAEWMANEGNPHWEIGCYWVQWSINNSISQMKTPQQKVFECDNFQRSGTVHSDIVPVKSAPSGAIDLPSLHSSDPIDLFNEPVISTSNPEQTYENIYDNVFIKEESNKEFEKLQFVAIDDIKLNTSNTKFKAYVNKRIVKNKPNILMEYVNCESNLSRTIIKKEPQENESSLMEVDCAPLNINQDINSDSVLEDIQIKNDFHDSGNICSVCCLEITTETYTCVKCMRNIHYECGGKVIGSGTDDPLVCCTCEQEVKLLKVNCNVDENDFHS